MKRNEARKLNHQEVADEDMRKKLPKNYEAMRRKAEWEVADKQAKQVCLIFFVAVEYNFNPFNASVF